MAVAKKFLSLLEDYQDLSKKIADQNPSSPEYAALGREYARLGPIVERIETLRDKELELSQTRSMLGQNDDPDLNDMISQEIINLETTINDLGVELKKLTSKQSEQDSRNAIVEIRAGTGGEEAALFAADLLRMYQRYSDLHDWSSETMHGSYNDIGGLREIIIKISGENVFARMKYESGTHRVQRVPVTESGGRVHTSAATVAVLPEASPVDITIDSKDLRIDVYRASGPGGQSVNTTDSAVRVTHIPTGINAQCQDEKSQHRNRAKAMTVLLSRLYDQALRQAEAERSAKRRDQIGSGDRSGRIRTYNFPQARVTDHRIGLTLYKLEAILDGEALDLVVDALVQANEQSDDD